MPPASLSSGRLNLIPMPDPRAQHRCFKFPAGLRVIRRREFERVFDSGVRTSDGRLTLRACMNGLGHSRLGVVVGRKHGGAVRRNRIKRVLREAFRLARRELPAGLDLLCSPRVGADIDLTGCVESLTRLAARLERRLTERNPRRVPPG
jgi:ribonuclease P protein component